MKPSTTRSTRTDPVGPYTTPFRSRRSLRGLVCVVQRVFFEAQYLIDDVAGIAAREAFEEQRMVPHANRQAGAAVGMGRTTAHRAARLPDAPQPLHDFGPARLAFRAIGSAPGRERGCRAV